MNEYAIVPRVERLELSIIPSVRDSGTVYHMHLNKKTIVFAAALGVALRAFTGLLSYFKSEGWDIEREDSYNHNGRYCVLSKTVWDGLEEIPQNTEHSVPI